MTTALEGGEGSASRPGHSLPPGKTRYPLYRRLGGPQGRSGQVRKISPPPGFYPRTVQSAASRYNDYATRPGRLRRIVVCFSSRRPGLDSSPVCVELRCTMRETFLRTSVSPFIDIPTTLHIHLRLTAAFISKMNWLFIVSSNKPMLFRVSVSFRQKFTDSIFLCSEV